MIIKFAVQFLHNVPFLTALFAMVTAQALKIFYYWIFERNFNLHHFFEVGGMPSSHSALVVCVSMMVGFIHGFDSSYFSIAAVLSSIVMYDAVKVRPEEVAHNLLQVSTGGLFGAIVAVCSYLIFIK
jgi:uncharacterized protein